MEDNKSLGTDNTENIDKINNYNQNNLCLRFRIIISIDKITLRQINEA